MPATNVVFYQDADGIPVLSWLQELQKKGQRKAWAKCRERIARFAEFGYDLRRPPGR